MKKLLAFALLCAAVMTHASTSYAQMVANGCPVGRGTNVQGYANACFETVAAMEAATIPDAVTEVETLNFYATPLGGGARYRYYGSSAPSYSCYRTTNSGTKYWVPKVQQINDKQCGSKVDGVTNDTAALLAMASFVEGTGVKNVLLDGGTSVITTAPTGIFVLSDGDGLSITSNGRIFAVTNEQNVAAAGYAFSFHNYQNIQFYGDMKFTGNLDGSGFALGFFTGSVGIFCYDNCTGFRNHGTVSVDGIGMAISIDRRPAGQINPYINPIIVSGGAGYTNGDVVTLSAFPAGAGNPGVVLGTYTVTAPAGVITALTPLTLGYYPWNAAGNVFSWPVPTSVQTGVPVTGGTGTGALISPYAQDADPQTMSNGGSLGLLNCRLATYCFAMQYNGNNFDVTSYSDTTYRHGFSYSNVGTKLNMTSVDTYQDALIIGSFLGIPQRDTSISFTRLPTTNGTICHTCNDIRLTFTSGTGVVTNTTLRSNVKYGTETNRAASHLVITRNAVGTSDLTYARGNIISGFDWSGQIDGYGDVDGGPGTGAVFGTSLGYTWTGEFLNNFVFNKLQILGATTTRGYVSLDSRAFVQMPGLVLAEGFQSSSNVLYSNGGGTTGPFTYADPSSAFVNKLVASGSFPIYTNSVSRVGSMIQYGTTSGAVTQNVQAAAGTYNWIYPNTAGTTGQPLVSGGGGALTWGLTPTACTNQFVNAISALGVGTCGTVNLANSVTGTLPVANGGTGTSTAFTAGSIVFAGASGTYSQDNANLFWDDTLNRLQVGNPGGAPLVSLEIGPSGSASSGAIRLFGTTVGAIGKFQIVDSDSGNGYILMEGGQNLYLGTNNVAKLGIMGGSTRSHIYSIGNAPATPTSCGTSPAINSNATDVVGQITVGTATPAGCTLTFVQTWTTAPICILRGLTVNDFTYAVSTSAITLTKGTADWSGTNIHYHCIGGT